MGQGVFSLNILAFKKEVHGTSGTSWDTFCPLGPYLAPRMWKSWVESSEDIELYSEFKNWYNYTYHKVLEATDTLQCWLAVVSNSQITKHWIFLHSKTDTYYSGFQPSRGHAQHRIFYIAKLTHVILVPNCKEYQFSIQLTKWNI